MRFGRIPLGEALGTVLAHTHRLPGRVFKKGTVLDDAAIEAFRVAGLDGVVAARLDPGDVGEDAAAARIADRLVGPGLTRTRAGTGRVNLVAGHPGLLRIDAAAVYRLNAVHEAVTLATLPDYAVVPAGEMVATVKIIPFAVPGTVLDLAETALAGPVLQLHRFAPLRVGLVSTTLPGLKESVLAGTEEATADRIAGLGGTLLPPLRRPHDEAAIAGAVRALRDDGAQLLLVVGASAVVDRHDVGPAGIVAAGGRILHFGMPVDPGNLICLGRIGDVPALVLPGCARSPKLNGIDWVLARVFAGLDVTGADLARMGVGGLLKDTGPRPLPRAKAPAAAPPRARPQVAAVVLAAGQSSRMAPHNKLLLPGRDGKPMVARVVDNLLSSRARPVLVIVGHRAAEVRAALGGRPVRFVDAAGYADGLSASLRAGIAAVPDGCAAAAVCLGDMPLVTGRMVDQLLDAYDADEGRTIVVPTYQGKVGNPVVWDRKYFYEINALSGDTGARKLLQAHADAVAEVPLGSDAVLRDFDTVESLADLPGHLRAAR